MSQRLKAVFAAILILASGLLAPAAEAQQAAPNPRIALVIGNATYRDAALATPANDAGLVAQTLQAAGFDVVGARDLDGQSLRTALRDFLRESGGGRPRYAGFCLSRRPRGSVQRRQLLRAGRRADQSRRRRADRCDPHCRFHPCSCRDAGQGAHHRARCGAGQSLRNAGLAPRAGACLGRSRARRTDRLQRRAGHAGRRRGRSLRRLRQDAGRRDPAGRRRYRPGVRSDARVGQCGDARRSCCPGAPPSLAAHSTSSNAPPTRLLRLSRSRRQSAGPYPVFPPRTPTPPLSSETP